VNEAVACGVTEIDKILSMNTEIPFDIFQKSGRAASILFKEESG
jgi:hypothetical protein